MSIFLLFLSLSNHVEGETMTKLTPFIKKIKTKSAYYIYDVYKNEILSVDRITFDLIEDFYQFSRDELIRRHKEKYSPEELKQRLTQLQYEVTQQDGTERPFQNTYWDNKKAGIYVDIVSGEPLFSSTDKYDSKTGWPSFTKPIANSVLVEKEDRKLWMVRTEVRSQLADSHLGHVFNDGPAPTGKRYCINSAALRFIPVEDLEKQNYGQYLSLFNK